MGGTTRAPKSLTPPRVTRQAAQSDWVFYHGTPDERTWEHGSSRGIHVGTQEAARQALNATIGKPLEGDWDGTREYGKTLLSPYQVTGHERNLEEPRYPSGRATYSNGEQVPMDARPNIFPVRITGPMIGHPAAPVEDDYANARMKAQITRGNARRGYFYRNVGEDYGSISAAVPSAAHLERVHPPREAARWRPSSGIFGPTTGLDQTLFDEEGSLRPWVAHDVMTRLDQCIRVDSGIAGSDWQDWTRVYLLGGSVSEWAGDRPNENARDLDVIVAIDLPEAHGCSAFEGMNAGEAASALNAAFRKRFNADGWKPSFGGTWNLTAFCNQRAWGIGAIKPYAAYDLTHGRWAVKPPHLPEHTVADFDPAVMRFASAVAAEARAVLKLPEPERTREATALWQRLHADRDTAFSEHGSGWGDIGNLTEKYLAYAPRHLLDKVKELVLAPKTAVAGRTPGRVVMMHPRDLMQYVETYRTDDEGGRRHRRDLADSFRQHGYDTELHGGMSGDKHYFPISEPIELVHEDQASYFLEGNHRVHALNDADWDEPVPVLVKDRRTPKTAAQKHPAKTKEQVNYRAAVAEPAGENAHPGPFYHGTAHEFRPGEMVEPGHDPNWSDEPEQYVSVSTSPSEAHGWAPSGGWSGKHVYEVHPTGHVWGGHGEYASEYPFRVIREVPEEEIFGSGHTASLEPASAASMPLAPWMQWTAAEPHKAVINRAQGNFREEHPEFTRPLDGTDWSDPDSSYFRRGQDSREGTGAMRKILGAAGHPDAGRAWVGLHPDPRHSSQVAVDPQTGALGAVLLPDRWDLGTVAHEAAHLVHAHQAGIDLAAMAHGDHEDGVINSGVPDHVMHGPEFARHYADALDVLSPGAGSDFLRHRQNAVGLVGNVRARFHGLPREFEGGEPIRREASSADGVSQRPKRTPGSAMVYLDVPHGTVEPWEGQETGHHVALAYLPRKIGDEDFARVVDRAREAAGRHAPMKATVSGSMIFPPGTPSDRRRASVVPVHAPGIHALHDEFADFDRAHYETYTPHVTRAQLGGHQADPPPHPEASFPVTHVHVRRGEEVHSFPLTGQQHTAAATPEVYLRFGHWPEDERSQNYVTRKKEGGVSAYRLDEDGDPEDPNPDSEPEELEEMQRRVHRAERNRMNGQDHPRETGHLVTGREVGEGHDGEPLLKDVRRVGDWIDHRHLFIDTAEPHDLAREPGDEGYEPPGEPHALTVPRATKKRGTAATGYTDLKPRSGMIYLDLPPGTVRQVPGGVDDHHVTLVYLGKNVSDKAFAGACRRTREAAAQCPPMDGVLRGIDIFPPSESSGGKVPAFVPAYIGGVGRLRRLLEDLSASEHTDYRPHVTLAYLEEGDSLPAPHPAVPLRFTRVHVKRGDEVVSFPLGGGMTREAAAEAPPSWADEPPGDIDEGPEVYGGLTIEHPDDTPYHDEGVMSRARGEHGHVDPHAEMSTIQSWLTKENLDHLDAHRERLYDRDDPVKVLRDHATGRDTVLNGNHKITVARERNLTRPMPAQIFHVNE